MPHVRAQSFMQDMMMQDMMFEQQALVEHLEPAFAGAPSVAWEKLYAVVDRELANCEQAFAAGGSSCMMPKFCADALNAANPGDTVVCRGFTFTKPQ
jgi:hypothetical protein